jgi:hypothetical protein
LSVSSIAQHEHPPSNDAGIEANLVVLVLLALRVSRSGRHLAAEGTGRVYVADSRRSKHHLKIHLRPGTNELTGASCSQLKNASSFPPALLAAWRS